MAYGILKVDTITFTDGGVDKSVPVSGLVLNPTFTGNVTVTGTISGNIIQGGTTVSGLTVTGTTANFASGVFTTQVSGLLITGPTVSATTGTFTSLTGTTTNGTTASFTTGNFTSLTGTTTTGTTANFASGVFTTQVSGLLITGPTVSATTGTFTSLTGTTTTGTTANFASGVFTTQISGVTITGTTVSTTTGNFTSLTGTTATITSGIIASGTNALPSLAILSDPNTGIYSPGADQLAVATNGTGKLFVDASGNVGVGVSPGYKVEVRDSSAPLIRIGDGVRHLELRGGSTTQNPSLGTQYGGDLSFFTNGSANERLRITSAGLVGIGTSAPGEALTVTNGALQVRGTLSSLNRPSSSVMDFQSSTGLTRFFSIGADASTHGAYSFCTATTTTNIERVRIDQSGRVGIGTTPVVDLDVAPAASTATFRIHARSNTTPVAAIELVRGTSTTFGADGSGDYRIKNDTGNLSFEYGDSGVTSERARIDSSGRLLVGTSTSTNNYKVQAESTDFGQISIRRNVGGAGGPALAISHSRGSAGGSYTALVNGDEFGGIYFYGADGTQDVNGATITALVDGTPGANDMPGRLVFSTTADGASSPTERMRITSTGVLQIADAGNITVGTTTGTKIGTATTQKLGFYNATPVVQPTAVADATTAVDVITQLNNLLAKLRTLGIIAT